MITLTIVSLGKKHIQCIHALPAQLPTFRPLSTASTKKISNLSLMVLSELTRLRRKCFQPCPVSSCELQNIPHSSSVVQKGELCCQ